MSIEREDAALFARVGRVRGVEVAETRPVRGGYSTADRRIVRFTDGTTAFLKLATTPDTARFLRDEMRIYRHVSAPFLARVLAWDDHPEQPLLLLEDLAHMHWPPPWTRAQVDAVLAMLEAVHSAAPPDGLESLDVGLTRILALSAGTAPSPERGWSRIAKAPAAFLALGLCSAEWWEHARPTLVAAERSAPIAGADLLHFDVRSDNLCVSGDRAVLIDWNWACLGNGAFDAAFWLPSLASEGGPQPGEILPKARELAALVSGFFASQAGLPPPAGAPGVRVVQTSQLRAALPWAVTALGLPPLDGGSR